MEKLKVCHGLHDLVRVKGNEGRTDTHTEVLGFPVCSAGISACLSVSCGNRVGGGAGLANLSRGLCRDCRVAVLPEEESALDTSLHSLVLAEGLWFMESSTLEGSAVP